MVSSETDGNRSITPLKASSKSLEEVRAVSPTQRATSRPIPQIRVSLRTSTRALRPPNIAARTFTTPPKGNNSDMGGGVVDAVTMKTAVAVALLPFAASFWWGFGIAGSLPLSGMIGQLLIRVFDCVATDVVGVQHQSAYAVRPLSSATHRRGCIPSRHRERGGQTSIAKSWLSLGPGDQAGQCGPCGFVRSTPRDIAAAVVNPSHHFDEGRSVSLVPQGRPRLKAFVS